MELADVVDSKSTAGDSVPVRVRPPAPTEKNTPTGCSSFFDALTSAGRPFAHAQKLAAVNAKLLDRAFSGFQIKGSPSRVTRYFSQKSCFVTGGRQL